MITQRELLHQERERFEIEREMLINQMINYQRQHGLIHSYIADQHLEQLNLAHKVDSSPDLENMPKQSKVPIIMDGKNIGSYTGYMSDRDII